MSDKRADFDLETGLSGAFRSADLPPAPGRLVEALERVPETPIVRGGARDSRGGSGRRTIFGVLGLAAVLLVGGTLALSVGSRPPTPLPAPSGPLTGDPSAGPAVVIAYQVGWTDSVPYSAPVLAEEIRIVQGRIDASGPLGVKVTANGSDRLNVAVPAGLDAEALRRLIGQTGHLGFVPLGDTQLEKGAIVDPTRFPELFGSGGVAAASVSTDQSGARVILFELTPAAADLFASYTAAHIGSFFAIALDGRVVSAPVINSEIPSGKVEISQGGEGGWDAVAANELVTIIRLKPLPAPLTEISAGPADPSTSPNVGPSPSNLLLPSPRTECEPPIEVAGSQLDCDIAIEAALRILPADRPTISRITFHHTCFDELHPNAAVDCAVQVSGIVEVTYVGGQMPALIGVRLDETGQPKAFVLPVRQPAASDTTFALERTPTDFGCDSMPPPYSFFVIHIDPSVAKPVWAIADTRARLRVVWGANDRGIAGTEPVVVDAFGRALARDGTRIEIPDGAWPSLNGRFVCPGPDAVYITDQPAP
jgi:hypothetical protein